MSDLLGCPFCGHSVEAGISYTDRVVVMCNCMPLDDMPMLKTWNRRAILPRERALLEATRYANLIAEQCRDDVAGSWAEDGFVVLIDKLKQAIAAYDAETK